MQLPSFPPSAVFSSHTGFILSGRTHVDRAHFVAFVSPFTHDDFHHSMPSSPVLLFFFVKVDSFDSLFQFLFHWRLFYLTLHAHVVHNVPLHVPQCCHKKLIPERGSIRPIIQQTYASVLPQCHATPNNVHGRRIRPRALQKPTVTSHDLIGGVARQVQKSLRGIYDRCGVGIQGINR